MGGGFREPIPEYNKPPNYCLKGVITRKKPRVIYAFLESHTAAIQWNLKRKELEDIRKY